MLDKQKSLCADCGFSEPTWAVVNRGLFICEECCSIHRSLGRHVSQLKSLIKSTWRPSQLNMVHMLNNSSINSLWEHSLNDPKCSRKKPHPNDPIHPVKADFIRAKHLDLSFVLRSRSSDNQEDLNQQLHSSVRTSNLETSLRLLMHGADPNYFHRDKGSFVVHVAAHAGQMEQFELLLCYGACPNSLDMHGNSPASCARMNGHLDIADKITECIYEVTDKFCYFLCKRTPNHKAGQHFFIPEISECITTPLLSKQARIKLQQLTNQLFEELVMDVYDEVDRRENEAVCRFSGTLSEQTSVPFLPVNPELSTMRNQGRQKLARLTNEEFSSLVWDILMDAKRRQNPYGDSVSRLKTELADDEPLYDSVASDEDYAIIDQLEDKQETDMNGSPDQKTDSKVINSVRTPELESELKSRIQLSESRITDLVSQVSDLQKKVDGLKEENILLRNRVERYQSCEEAMRETEPVLETKPRPTSLYNIAQKYIGASNNTDRISPPQADEVLRRTDQVTKRLQELSTAMRSSEARHAFVPCAERIRVAVADLSSIFPQGVTDEVVRTALRSLNTNTIRMQAVCSEVESTMDRVRKCAFNMAKATRQILTQFQ